MNITYSKYDNKLLSTNMTTKQLLCSHIEPVRTSRKQTFMFNALCQYTYARDTVEWLIVIVGNHKTGR